VLTLLLLAVLCLPLVAASEGRAAGCLSGGCHAEISGRKVVHAPAGEEDCVSCHQREKEAHPSGSGPDFGLTATGGALCFQCHAPEDFGGRHRHGPSASGNCLACHDPHGAAETKLLRMPLKDLCLDCHRDFAESMEQSAHLHTAIRKLDCAACHQPHGSDSPGLLKGDSIELCFGCHQDIRGKYDSSLTKHKALYIRQRCGNCHSAHFSPYPALLVRERADLCYTCHGQDDPGRSDAPPNIRGEIEGKEHVHGPVAEGECAACHDPHGSNHAGLLSGPFPKSFYAPYEPDEYDFCFQCHDKELLTAQPVGEQTGFRNGTDNLHYRHVARKQKGRTCLACHSVHASNGQKLINPEGIPFGKWKIPIRFAATETGGGCVPGCHRSLDYDRQTPVDYSKPAAAKPQSGEGKEAAKQEGAPTASPGKPEKDGSLDKDSGTVLTEPLDTEPLDTEQKKQ
jgi:predicted CXXCH cytochrome family protein